ncbi:ribosomal protection-like ABC-F family protein [Geomicrobium sp. JSM 1781026]|uniref:ribosomal protection-like ABC-F family protein n=1 Tax=Geomicrobium sp. JSM 1781026 TaxID=3344580 RepID=UPI0035C16213
MIVCYAHQIEQTYGGTTIFSNLSFEIQSADRIGLVGQNGSGKSTLAQLAAGEELPIVGTIGWQKNTSKGLLAQIPDHSNEGTVYEVLQQSFEHIYDINNELQRLEELLQQPDQTNLEQTLHTYGLIQERFEAVGGYEMDALIRRVSDGLGINTLLDASWEALSGGERAKVELAHLLLTTPDLLILDEPTNHLDLYALEWLSKWVRNYKGAVLIISHDRAFLDDTTIKTWEIEQGTLHTYNTNYSGYVLEREERLLKEFQAYTDQQKKINKMKETIKRLKDWANRANPPNAGMHRQAKSMEKALQRIQQLERPVHKKKISLTFNHEKRTGNDVFTCHNVHKSYAHLPILQNASMHIRYGERVAIVGPNGAGKSTLLHVLTGEVLADDGEVTVGTNVSIGYLSQHPTVGDQEDTIVAAFKKEVAVTEARARHILASFHFFGHDVFKTVVSLSGGELMRLRLAQLMHQNHNVLILDEPTNHLDIDAQHMIEDAIEGFTGTIVAVSHNRYFLNKCFPTTFWLEDGQLTKYEGSFRYAYEKRVKER